MAFLSVDAIEFILTYSSSLAQIVSSPEISFPAEKHLLGEDGRIDAQEESIAEILLKNRLATAILASDRDISARDIAGILRH